uniref:Uncharacterized protein n=1 Tax=Manihot esculenta TaxID=3983 RepID=A0A2C9V6J8_MANES
MYNKYSSPLHNSSHKTEERLNYIRAFGLVEKLSAKCAIQYTNPIIRFYITYIPLARIIYPHLQAQIQIIHVPTAPS